LPTQSSAETILVTTLTLVATLTVSPGGIYSQRTLRVYSLPAESALSTMM
jgi:hypothetical protein